ncbi:IclR family transcriptional regulator [Paracoccus xiamenensis]|uniref:IclR family transcriptional regulator n=1 Tax=Paracoccus xiamenensis TaxID=2714901 RepID=UPI00140C654A|nr:helix-turn-helix domain-containing protein [Paracoccus xiamenensis]NHF74414.1 helix-turn-helix domain-containing protein [Paracoccus xiamenensis]
MAEQERNSLMINALSKSLALLRAFGDGHAVLGITELVRLTGIEKSSVQRILATLHSEGMLIRDNKTRRYRLSNKWLHMAYAHYIADPLSSQVMPRLFDLQQQLGQALNLAEICDTSIMYTLRLPVKRTSFEGTLTGRTHPALNTSGGRAILSTWGPTRWQHAAQTWPLGQYTPRTTQDRGRIAELIAKAHEDGYAISEQEVLLNEIGIGIPIKSPGGEARAAIHCSVSLSSWTIDQARAELVPVLLDTARTFFVPEYEDIDESAVE